MDELGKCIMEVKLIELVNRFDVTTMEREDSRVTSWFFFPLYNEKIVKTDVLGFVFVLNQAVKGEAAYL